MAIVIILIIAAIVMTATPLIRAKAEAVKCGNNMRQLHVALSAAVQDLGHWPQVPLELWESDNENLTEDWWIDTMKVYGPTESLWQCPTVKRKVLSKVDDGRPRIHYSPTMFDDKPGTPYKWPKQPWVIEIGNMHGAGPLVSFPDGSVRPMNEVLLNQ